MADLVISSARFIGSSVFLARTIVKVFYQYYSDGKVPLKNDPSRNIGMNKQDDTRELPGIVDIKNKLPKQCFQPTVMESLYFLAKDFVLIAMAYWAVTMLHSMFDNHLIWYTSLMLYWAFQGTMFTSVFVVGHDCGHDSFSHYPLLNDIVGQLTHGFLFCPFYMWKLSHRHHHKNNNNFDRDEVFYPVKKSDKLNTNDTVLPGFGFGTGWFAYLFAGYSPRRVFHFTPRDKMFQGHVTGCVFSLLTLAAWSVCLFKYASAYGALALFNYWFVPVFIFASYCVIITFLHHTEVNIPWYNNKEWDFVRGQLATIDRDYGIVKYLIHNIGTHQVRICIGFCELQYSCNNTQNNTLHE